MNRPTVLYLPARVLIGVLVPFSAGLVSTGAVAAEPSTDVAYTEQIQPLLERYCHDCHAEAVQEAEIDLARFATAADVASDPEVWMRIRGVLDSGQMPPPDVDQPTSEEMLQLRQWVRGYLAELAKADAGDPGPVLLRRLNNAEYNYTIRDLTGVKTLDPTREFPIDGAAGEGFTNTGSGQGMSPAMVQKYLDAAKEIASHAVLTPTGIRFSSFQSRRDQTDELKARIQAFYRRWTEDGGGSAVDLQGIKFDTNQGGLLPLDRYLLATIEQRAALRNGDVTISQVAAERGLSEKYLGLVWRALNETHAAGEDAADSFILESLREHWRNAGPTDVPSLVALVDAAQERLWKFNTIGHIGLQGGPSRWMEPVTPIAESHEVRVPLAVPTDGHGTEDVVVYLVASELADGDGDDIMVWQQPRLEFPARYGGSAAPPVPLAEIRDRVPRVREIQRVELARTAEYLRAVVEMSGEGSAHDADSAHATVADRLGLRPEVLRRWADLLEVQRSGPVEITGHLSEPLSRVHGADALHGWASRDNPSMLANSSDDPIQVSTLTVPARGVTVHPSPDREAVVAWQSPVATEVRISGRLADADANCGNGIAWRLEHRAASGSQVLAEGIVDNGGEQTIGLDGAVRVQAGDALVLVVHPRDRDHACDTTAVTLRLEEVGGDGRVWDLAGDVVDSVQQGNPLADSYGHPATWHFCASEIEPAHDSVIPKESALARWRDAWIRGAAGEELLAAAQEVQAVLMAAHPGALSDADATLRERLRDWAGPMRWLEASGSDVADSQSSYGVDPGRFGKSPEGADVDERDLCVRAPHVLEVRLPAELADSGAELVTTAALHSSAGGDASVQVRAATEEPQEHFDPTLRWPVLARPGTPGAVRLAEEMDVFRRMFPPALCYARIVPVDEVVTLTLFYREDDHLRRLMLDEDQVAELERLWDELYFVSQEPIELTVALEQLIEFATQDQSQAQVDAFRSLREPFEARADKFRQRMIDVEPRHVEAAVALADSAWRRPISDDERQALRGFYTRLRGEEMPHEEAVRLVIARVFTSPAFLFKLEQPAPGADPGPVSDHELAVRLSYFLWSSMPDQSLREMADAGGLTDAGAARPGDADPVVAQARRMLGDPRARRLAIQFACQWLHLRDFDKNDDKNESLYPEFAELREDMYEETVRFFEDMFRNDGSILDLLEADHTFVNAELARHYGIEGVDGDQWRRIDGVQELERGGILGMASLLASQSGASRTSPILRGNWVYETLLGERLPRPPPDVPILPDAVPEGLTARELIELHSGQPGCAKCHVLVDPFGFALEQYDAIGRLRPEPVDTAATLVDGQSIDGLEGLRRYLAEDRRDDVVRQFCRKLLGYALGREVQLSDELLIDQMRENLRANDYRFSAAVETIVRSEQFRQIRGAETVP